MSREEGNLGEPNKKRLRRLGNAPNKSMIRARNLLVELLLFLSISIGESCWYTINGGTDEYSLASRRLGFFRKDEYYAFLVGTGLTSYTYAVNRLLMSVRRRRRRRYKSVEMNGTM